MQKLEVKIVVEAQVKSLPSSYQAVIISYHPGTTENKTVFLLP
jgi:hypothetical protein